MMAIKPCVGPARPPVGGKAASTTDREPEGAAGGGDKGGR